MFYSRANPSPRYRELQQMYRRLHEDGERQLGLPPEKTFNGMSLMPQLERIKALLIRTGARNVLDYGCGKGQQYRPMRLQDRDGTEYRGVVHYWNVDAVHCYDPCYLPYSRLPEGQFDAVVSTDVLEHCPEQDIPWIIDEMFSFAKRCVYVNIACYPARKHLPNGENAHCTIKPRAWWEDILRASAARCQNVVWEAWVQSVEMTTMGPKPIEELVSG
jgi:hypothetical protein